MIRFWDDLDVLAGKFYYLFAHQLTVALIVLVSFPVYIPLTFLVSYVKQKRMHSTSEPDLPETFTDLQTRNSV